MTILATPELDSRPVLSVCLIVRNCADDLERCLKSVRARAPRAEIVCVDTMSGDDGKTLAVAKRYADKVVEYDGPEHTWTREMFAFDDAAAARNESFKYATGKWVMWIDADDELPDAAETKRLLEVNGRRRAVPGKVLVAADGEPGISLEEILEQIDEDPKTQIITGFWAPYLYRFAEGKDGEQGVAMTWQTRERIVRNDGSWSWARKAHEVLVPKDPKAHRAMGTLGDLLFVHRKNWDPAAVLYSLNRHRAILEAGYARGERNCQDLLYLENYAIFVGGVSKRREYIAAALDCAHTPIDRARVLCRQASLAEEQGYFHDTVASYAAAIEVDSGYADAYFRLAQVYERAEHWFKATEWYERGVAVSPAHPFSDVTPREHLIGMRIRGALCASRASRLALDIGNLNLADSYAEKAVVLALAAYNEPCIGTDRAEAAQWVGLFENERDALKVAHQLHSVWDYLKKNDETLKGADLLGIVPHNLKNHPVIVQMEKWATKLRKHLTDPAAYQTFYEEIGTDVTSNAGELPQALPRTIFAINVLKAEQTRLGRPLRILEVGPFDGITTLPIMKALPDCAFTGLEIKADAAKRLAERVVALQLPNKFEVLHGQLDDAFRLLENRQFDAVIFFEVIEHVGSPELAIAQLGAMVRPGGLLFVSTPWGAFDRGHQPMADVRDARGHVRAMTPAELVDVVEASGRFAVEEQSGCHGEANYGDTLHLVARAMATIYHRSIPAQDISFVVPSALWDWNASSLIRTGMGASEETIVFLARELATDANLKVRVYGPLPKFFALDEEEVNSRVQYLPRVALRHLGKEKGQVVVSRAPRYGLSLDEAAGRTLDKTLWLQDAYYPDLTTEVAAAYKQIVVLSRWHRDTMRDACGVPESKMVLAPNFLLAEHFDVQRVQKANAERAAALKDGAPKFVYASSPDRGLIELLSVWPHVIKEWPKAELRIFYGWEGCMKLSSADAGWNSRYRALREAYLKLRTQPGIIEIGRVNHTTIADEMRRAHVFPYVTSFAETWCSNAMKARAAGCIPVVSPVAALNESASCSQTVWVPYREPGEGEGDFLWRYFLGIKAALEAPDASREAMAELAIEEYELAAVLPIWKKILGL